MSSSNRCFLTCIQISQEAGKVVWYSHLFQNFPQFVVIHTVKGPEDSGVKECVLIFSCKKSKITTHFLLNLPCLFPLLDPDTLDSPTPEDGGSQRRSHWSSGLIQLFDYKWESRVCTIGYSQLVSGVLETGSWVSRRSGQGSFCQRLPEICYIVKFERQTTDWKGHEVRGLVIEFCLHSKDTACM